MCRFVAYHGHPVLIADLLYRPRHSLVRQSMQSELMSQTFNADGFGVGFYNDGDSRPCIVRSPAPAWSNRGLESIASRIHSTNIFAHVRAASPGMPVQDTNCHPFGRGSFQFMHNGYLESLRYFKRRLQNDLSDLAWEGIEGSTDSEHAFALFIDQIGGLDGQSDPFRLRSALIQTIARLVELNEASSAPGAMLCNFAVSDGRSTVVSRFAHRADSCSSLFYSAGERYLLDGEDGDMLPASTENHGAVIVASEPITRRPEDWIELPVNHTITINVDHTLQIERIVF
jgi:predicted glutamine amidotransferase